MYPWFTLSPSTNDGLFPLISELEQLTQLFNLGLQQYYYSVLKWHSSLFKRFASIGLQ